MGTLTLIFLAMRSGFLFVLAFFSVITVRAQIPSLTWVKNAGSLGAGITPRATTTDAAGNVYVTGEFTGTADFDPGAGTFQLTASDDDAFVLKLDANGNFDWAIGVGSTLPDAGQAITIDNAGSVLVVGTFYDIVDFNPGVGTFELTSLGSTDIFILKLTAAGNFVFARQIGSADFDRVTAVATDGSNRIFVTGAFPGLCNFDPGASDTELTSSGAYDGFLAKYEANGSFAWANQYDLDGGADVVEAIDVDLSGNPHIAGEFEVSGTGAHSIFVKQVDNDGAEQWGNQYGSEYGNSAKSIQVNSTGDVFFSGSLEGTVDFDPSGSGFTLTGPDAYVCRLTSAGSFVWALQLGHDSNAGLGAMAIDANSNIFLLGSYATSIDLDPGGGIAMLYSLGGSDYGGSFLQKLNSSGDYVWGQSILNSTFNVNPFVGLAALSIDNTGRLVVTGSFSETAVFSTGICVNGTSTSTSESDLFVMKLNVDAGPPTCFGVVLDPVSSTICMGSSVLLIAYGAGAPRVTYQWQRFNGTSFVNISDQAADGESGDEGYGGTDTPFLTVTSIANNGTADFRCVVSGQGVSDVFSATATLTYLPSSAIPYVVANSGCGPGRYMITAYGQTDGNYKWYDSNGTEISGEVNSTYTTPFISSPTKFSVAKGLGACLSEPAPVLVKTDACANVPGLVWATQPQTTDGSVRILEMVIDATGNIYATGSFNGTVDFDPGAGTASLTATTSTEYFLLKMKEDQSLVWVKALGALSSAIPSLSGDGSLYVAGNFRGTVDFDPNAAIVSLTATGNLSMFITKFDTDGNLVWAKMMGGSGSALVNARSVASDANGVYTTGSFSGSIDFDPNGTTLNLSASSTFTDIFICKLSPNGTLNGGTGFAYRIGNNAATDAGRAISVDAAGNIYSVGTFFGTTTDFNPGAGSTVLIGGGATDFYMHKLSNTGVFQWARNIGGAGVEIPFDIVVDASGNSFITGTFGTIITNQTVDFDPGAGVANLVSTQGILFALKLDADGNYVWAKNFGGTSGSQPNDIAIDGTGNVLITGSAQNNADFDPGPDLFRLQTNVNTDAFLNKLDASGNFLWAYNLQSTGLSYGFNEGLSVVTYSDGSIFLSGALSHSSDLDPGPCTYALFRSSGNAFIQKVKPGVVTMCFNLQPNAVAGCEGTDATLSTLATGTTNITYQWQKLNTVSSLYEDLTDTGIFQGTTTADLTISTSSAAGNGDYRCVVSGNLVPDLNSKVAGLNITADNPPTTTGATGCPATGIPLTASGGTVGQYRWYEDDLTTLVAGQTDDTFTTPPLTDTKTYYVSIITGVCESSLTPVVATVQTVTLPATTGASMCGPGILTIAASGGTNGSYRWYDVSTGGVAISGEVNSAYITPVLTTSATYYATLFDGTCESLRVPVSATIFAVPAKPVVSNSGAGSFCTGGSVTLTVPTAASYAWSSGETTQQISVTTSGTFTASVTDANGCTSETSDPLVISVLPLPAKPIVNASGALSFCDGGSVTLSTASASAYSWSGGQTSQQLTVTASENYAVTITDVNGCQSPASDVVSVVVNALPAKPVIDSGGITSFCNGQSLTLSAPTGYTYVWSTGATTRQIVASTAGSYTVQVLDANLCTSLVSDAVVITVNNCNQPPVITTTSTQTDVNGSVSVSLSGLLSDPDNNIDYNTLSVFEQPLSGATAFINTDLELVIDYSGISFSGTDELTIEVCDDQGACTQQKIFIEVLGEVVILNGLSPNGDGINDFFHIKYIEAINETKDNRVTIFNRWGDPVFEIANYDNKERVFRGQNKNGNDLPSGTYLYRIDFAGNYPQQTGYLVIKR